LVVSAEQGHVILAGQAIYSRDECEHIERNGKLPPNDPAIDDAEAYLESALRLIRVRPVAMHFSHDSAVWHGAAGDSMTRTSP
jgi:hypothetical protein